jgi:polyisoprenoid-binding protein YceI
MSTIPANAADGRGIGHTRWRIDPQRSGVEFHVRNLYGLQTVKGRFERYDGTLDLAAEASIELTIEADSLTTGNARRDEQPAVRRFLRYRQPSAGSVRFT